MSAICQGEFTSCMGNVRIIFGSNKMIIKNNEAPQKVRYLLQCE